jgi:hypothetical protein
MDKYGLIGYPLGHSFSKGYFNEKFENEGIDAQYINFEIPSIEDLTEILDSNPELKGLNVTIPYKEKVISYLDLVSPEANAIGAVNVVKVEHKGDETILKGYNSDVIGFTQSIEPFIESFHKKALILGTGDVEHFLWREGRKPLDCLLAPSLIDIPRESVVQGIVGRGDVIKHLLYQLSLFSCALVGLNLFLFIHYLYITYFCRAIYLIIYYLCAASHSLTFFSMRAAMSPSSVALSNFSPVMCSYSSM